MKIDVTKLTKHYNATPDASSYGEPLRYVVQMSSMLDPESRVIDLGAGDGRNTLCLARVGHHVHAVDILPAALEKLVALATAADVRDLITTETADLAGYVLPGLPRRKKWDGVVICLALHYLDRPTALKLLTDAKERSAPNGLHVINLFTSTGYRVKEDNDSHPEAFYPNDGWLKEFYNDWEIIRCEQHVASLINRDNKTNVVEQILARKPQ